MPQNNEVCSSSYVKHHLIAQNSLRICVFIRTDKNESESVRSQHAVGNSLSKLSISLLVHLEKPLDPTIYVGFYLGKNYIFYHGVNVENHLPN